MFTSKLAAPEQVRRDFPAGWYPVAPLRKIKEDQLNSFEICGRKLLVLSDPESSFSVYDRACPHMGIDLARGKLCRGQVVCPYHEAPFSGATGKYTGDVFKTPMRLRSFPSTVRYGWLWFYNGSMPHYELPEFSEETHEFTYQSMTVRASMDNLMLNAIDSLHLVYLHKGLLTSQNRFYEVEQINDYAFRCYLNVDTVARGFLNIEAMDRTVYGPSLSVNGVTLGGQVLNYRLLTFRPMSDGRTQIIMINCILKDRPRGKITPLLPPHLKVIFGLVPPQLIAMAVNITLFFQDLVVTKNIISDRRTPDEIFDRPAMHYFQVLKRLQKQV